MGVMTDVAVIGAGPYGLSLAAHLRARGADIRVFGFPMQSWRDSMPVGMKLKSEGFASNISDPNGALSLGTFCREMNIPYADTNLLVSLAACRTEALRLNAESDFVVAGFRLALDRTLIPV